MVKTAEFIKEAIPKTQEYFPINPQPALPKENTEILTLNQEEIRLLKLVVGYQTALHIKDTLLASQILSELYELCVDKIYRYIYFRVGNQQDAEDLTSMTFQKMVEHLPRFKSQNKPFQRGCIGLLIT